MLLNKIKKKKIIIGIIGLGYVGLPRSIQFCENKIKVYGFDVDQSKIKKLKKYQSYLSNVKNENIKKIVKNKNFFPTSNLSLIKFVDIIIICLPTPLNNKLNPDLSYIKNTFVRIKKFLKEDQLICLESTTYPGTTKEIFLNYLKRNFEIGKNFYLGYSPERNDPGSNFNISNIPKLISGYSKNCLNVVDSIYKLIFTRTIKMNSIELAEITKIYENVYRAVNISFVNEMKKICTRLNLNIDEIISAAKTKPFGFEAFYPGPGFGGHCIPIDPFYLSWKAKKHNINTEFIELSGRVNRSIPKWIVQQLKKKLPKKKRYRILILGIAYKKNINDCRESPAFEIINILRKNRFSVNFNDPFIKNLPKTRKYDFSNIDYIRLNRKSLKSFDAAILITDHDNFNYKFLKNNLKLIIDTRHKFKGRIENVTYA